MCKKPFAHAKVDERRLNTGLEINDPALVDVPDVVILARSFDIKLFQYSVFNNRDPAFLGLRHVD